MKRNLIVLMLLCVLLFAADSTIVDETTSPLMGIIDYIMANFWGLLISVLAGAGISLAIVWKTSREIGQFLIAAADFGDGTAEWALVKKEFIDIVMLFKNKNPLDTIKAANKSKKLVAGLALKRTRNSK